MSFDPSPSSFGPAKYGSSGAAQIQNSFADFEFVTLPAPGFTPVKLSRAYGPNFSYTSGSVPILVAFGDAGARQFLFLPGETLEGFMFQDAYVWAYSSTDAGQTALVKWGAQRFRPSLRQLPANPVLETTVAVHVPAVGEYGGTNGGVVLSADARRLFVDVFPAPLQQLFADTGSSAAYVFGIGASDQEAVANCALAIEEVASNATFPVLGGDAPKPYGYAAGTTQRNFARLYGNGDLYFCHNLTTALFANTPYFLNFKETRNTF